LIDKMRKKEVNQHEKDLLTREGFRPNRASGATWINPEDGEDDNFIVQLKMTNGRGIRVQYKDLYKLIKNSRIAHKKPLFMLCFLENKEEVFYLIRKEEFDKIRGELIEN